MLHDSRLLEGGRDAIDPLGVEVLEQQLLLDLLAPEQLLSRVRVEQDGGDGLGHRLGKDQPGR